MTCKLIFKNIGKNIKDYFIYFLTLVIAISLFYAFNAVMTSGAINSLSTEAQTMSEALGNLIELFSRVLAVIMAFLVLYVNRFLLKRRKKELGLYMLLGMKKGKISRIFVGETFLIGICSLVVGILFGIFFAQLLTVAVLKAFGGGVSGFSLGFSMHGFWITLQCFGMIYLLVMLFNVFEVAKVKLIDLLLAERKNEEFKQKGMFVYGIVFLLGILCAVAAAVCLRTDELIPTMKMLMAGVGFVVASMLFLFYSLSAVIIGFLKKRETFYYKGINAFLVRQIGSRIQGNFVAMAMVSFLITVMLILVTAGCSIGITMGSVLDEAAPFDYVLLMNPSLRKDYDVLQGAKEYGVDFSDDVKESFQFQMREGDLTYKTLFEGQQIDLWSRDKELVDKNVDVLSIKDYNQCMKMQGKETVSLGEEEFLINCNYDGDKEYVRGFLETGKELWVAGVKLKPASKMLMENAYYMTSVGDNDRGTLIVPDAVAEKLPVSACLSEGFFKEGVNTNQIQKACEQLEKKAEGNFGWTTKARMGVLYYSALAIPVFFCTYVGLIFLLICVALLSVQQLTEMSDNRGRYEILRRQGVSEKILNKTIGKQVGVYFLAPLVMGVAFTAAALPTVMKRVSDFCHMQIGTNMSITFGILLLVYGGYYIATYLACEKMI